MISSFCSVVLGVSLHERKMARPNWASSAVLIWLLAAETAFSHPKPAETETASFVTQYPPVPSNGRVLIPHDLGVSEFASMLGLQLTWRIVLSNKP